MLHCLLALLSLANGLNPHDKVQQLYVDNSIILHHMLLNTVTLVLIAMMAVAACCCKTSSNLSLWMLFWLELTSSSHHMWAWLLLSIVGPM